MSRRRAPEVPIIHPFISFLTRKVELVYDLWLREDAVNAFKAFKGIMLFLRRITREENQFIIEEVDKIIGEIESTSGINFVQTFVLQGRIVMKFRKEKMNQLITALTDALFDGGYLMPETYGIVAVAGDRRSGTRNHLGYPDQLSSEVRK